jgi:hypothetical protein
MDKTTQSELDLLNRAQGKLDATSPFNLLRKGQLEGTIQNMKMRLKRKNYKVTQDPDGYWRVK